jgi:hypothetical protein
MMAAIALRPVVGAAFHLEAREPTCPVVHRRDPALAALVQEIKAVEGDTIAEPPLAFRLVEICGLGMIAASLAGIASCIANLVA